MRDFVKTMTFAALHFMVGFGVTYALTGSLSIATGVALIEPAVNTVVFYLHEKVWRMARPESARVPVPPCGHGHGHGALLDHGVLALPQKKPVLGAP